eukprot:CAMPEP_0196820450 /NCGR_PEP_ID=MMETSP1362-20130617/75343_1 /TAXON_ID=163516 /ORGANISM="Leptocylindrus danicus, Strain CCMP1856" /LENGTH=406 /DNA_ID=CAMNT_0042199341 /DNA_START=158 /DNA_END=1378 /DNA_ORIENTATION=+
MIPGVWEWPASERTPVKCSVDDKPGCWPGDANNELKQMGLQADDVFRLVEMTLFLMILMPLSLKWLASRWHAAIQLHRLINIVYFVDIVRRHSHPHSWVLNTPVFIIYCIDAFVWSNYWRRNNSPEVKRVKLGKDYMVLYWVSPFPSSKFIAPHYSIIMKEHDTLEEKHIFTCFENRMGIPIYENEEDFKWNAACVIRVFRDRRTPQLGKLEQYSHTQRMYKEDPDYIITGPVPGEMSLKLQSSYTSSKKEILLIGAGSAANFIIDFLLWLSQLDANKQDNKMIHIIYTARNDNLFEWVAAVFAEITSRLDPCISGSINIKLSHTGEMDLFGEEGLLANCSLHQSVMSLDSTCHSTSMLNERVDLHKNTIPCGSKVFCQGSAPFKDAVKKACKKANASFFGGEGGH